MTKPFDIAYERSVALNTLALLYALDLQHNLYFNSPNTNEFDGSATGYWERRAVYFGATIDAIDTIKRDIKDRLEGK